MSEIKDRSLTVDNFRKAMSAIVLNGTQANTLVLRINYISFMRANIILYGLGLDEIVKILPVQNANHKDDPIYKNFSEAWRIEDKSGNTLYESDAAIERSKP